MNKQHEKYSDKYFLRSKAILEKKKLNPIVEMQVFIRKGPGYVRGLDEAVQYIKENSDIEAMQGEIHTLKEDSDYSSGEVVMKIIAPIQSIIALETQYLGIISYCTTRENEEHTFSLSHVTDNVKKVVKLVDNRPVFYFGARHWHYNYDKEISRAAFKGGVIGCSTDNGAEIVNKKGMGTIPHALIVVFASKYGKEKATLEATKAFNKHIDKRVKCIALVDTFNREITDSLLVAKALGKKLYAVRIDTCGENFGETCIYQKGVTTELASKVRLALDKNGFKDVRIVLSSGFAKSEKVKQFIDVEKKTGLKLFDALGCGQFFESRTATADIVKVDGKPLSKTGRKYKENKRLIRRL